MKHIILAILVAGLAVNVYAAKPEWTGDKEAKKELKAESKAAKKGKKATDKDGMSSLSTDSQSILDKVFSGKEKAIIEDYYNENARSETGKHKGQKKELPRGLQKKLERGGELPPGWQKKLAKGEVLDPELRLRSESLPDELLSRLPSSDITTKILKIKIWARFLKNS